MAANHPDLALGFEDDGWWSRAAQPQMPAWSDDQPRRLGETPVPAKDPGGKAVACSGLYVPTANQMVWRVGRGRPVSLVTGAFLAWRAVYVAAPGTRALLLLGDTASWHGSQVVQAWINAHHRNAKHAGGCRFLVCRLPSQSPWLKPIEPKWVQGTRAIVEPTRVLPMAELMPRVCASYQCELTDPSAQPDC
jgi:hypothetical protein